MRTITVCFNSEGVDQEEKFPDNKPGNKKALEFLQQLKDKYASNPYFFNLDKVKAYKYKEENAPDLSDAKWKARKRKNKQEDIRRDYLRANKDLVQPVPLKVTITVN